METARHYRWDHGWFRYLGWLCPPCATAMRNREAVPRIAPAELYARISRGQSPAILDLRHPLDSLGDSRVIPGAARTRPQDLAWGKLNWSPDQPIVTYCAMQDQAASEHAARLLQGRGFHEVWVLAGGWAGWRDAGLPLLDACARTGLASGLMFQTSTPIPPLAAAAGATAAGAVHVYKR